jgi:hypothetical protein
LFANRKNVAARAAAEGAAKRIHRVLVKSTANRKPVTSGTNSGLCHGLPIHQTAAGAAVIESADGGRRRAVHCSPQRPTAIPNNTGEKS